MLEASGVPCTRHPGSGSEPSSSSPSRPIFAPTFLHRDFSHRNLLWPAGTISGVVDWVETSSGPAWLDAAHAATNLAVAFGPEAGDAFVDQWAATSGTPPEPHWLVMDAVGFLPPPGRAPMFGSPGSIAGLDQWLVQVVATDGCLMTRSGCRPRPSASSTFLLGCTRGGSPGILG